MKPVAFDADAEEEIRSALQYCETKRPGLGREFRTELEATIERIQRRPQSFPADEFDARECALQRFPYTVYYVELEDRIWIAAVAHQHRLPGYWEYRKPD